MTTALHTRVSGDGPPLVLLHGFAVDHRLLTSLDATLDGACRRVYVDLPGMGRSPAGPEVDGSEAVLDAVLATIDAATGGEPFAVLGSSYGGMLARAVAHRRRDRVTGLALLAPVVVADTTRTALPLRTTLVADPGLLASLDPADAAEFAEMAVVQSPAAWALFRDHALPGIRAADADALARIRSRYALDAEPEDGAPPFARPTLVVCGRQDHVVGYADALGLLPHYPRATVAVLDAAGHNVHLDQPAVVGGLVVEWLRRVRAGPVGG